MDALTYLAAKAEGKASVIRHGDTTLLFSLPGGFDPRTGAGLPNVDQGLQRADLVAIREVSATALVRASEALAAAQADVDAWDQILVEVDALLK